MNDKPILGYTFAESTAAIARCADVTYRVAKLNHSGWRTNQKQELFWRLVVPVQVATFDLSDEDLALAMLRSAKAIIEDRLAALEPTDGLERVTPRLSTSNGRPADLRTKEGRAWRAAQQQAVTV